MLEEIKYLNSTPKLVQMSLQWSQQR